MSLILSPQLSNFPDTPELDPNLIRSLYKGQLDANLMTIGAGGSSYHIFESLRERPLNIDELSIGLGLSNKGTAILVGSLQNLGLLEITADKKISITSFGRESVIKGEPFCVAEYFILCGSSPDLHALRAALSRDDYSAREHSELASVHGVEDVLGRQSKVMTPRPTIGQSPDLIYPTFDATPLFDLLRLKHLPDIVSSAANRFKIFDVLSNATSLDLNGVMERCALQRRPALVMLTALRSLGFIDVDAHGRISIAPTAVAKLPELTSELIRNHGTLDERGCGICLADNGPLGGLAYVAGASFDSPMDDPKGARILTEALRGRAQHVAPFLADAVDLSGAKVLADVGGGSGIYSAMLLLKNPELRIIFVERPAVIEVAREYFDSYGVADRVSYLPGNMFTLKPPKVDAVLISNVLHDWDEDEAGQLVSHWSQGLNPGGQMLIHDAFLNPVDLTHDCPIPAGPKEIAAYSWALFCATKGRAYSVSEFQQMVTQAGLEVGQVRPTAIQCSVLSAFKK